jgi:hypothetical protein
MMGQLERRTETISGEFKPQDVANTLWAFATMGTKSGDRMMGQLKQQVQQAERARSLTLGQRRFSGTAVALVLALATAAVALAAVL